MNFELTPNYHLSCSITIIHWDEISDVANFLGKTEGRDKPLRGNIGI
jgi:hypothetical protein